MPNQRRRIARYLNHLCAGSPQKNMEALGPLGAIVGTIIALADGAVCKFWRRQVPNQRLRIARYLNHFCAGSSLGPRIALYK